MNTSNSAKSKPGGHLDVLPNLLSTVDKPTVLPMGYRSTSLSPLKKRGSLWTEHAKIVHGVSKRLQIFPTEIRLKIFRNVFDKETGVWIEGNVSGFEILDKKWNPEYNPVHLYDWCLPEIVGLEVSLDASEAFYRNAFIYMRMDYFSNFARCSHAHCRFKPAEHVRGLHLLILPADPDASWLGKVFDLVGILPKLQTLLIENCTILDILGTPEEYFSLKKRGVEIRM